MLISAVIPTPFGTLEICTEDSAQLTRLTYLPADTPLKSPSNLLQEQASEQLQRYFSDPAYVVKLPLKQSGSTFQNQVWDMISAIPLGKTRTYGEIAHALGNSSAARAVGGACGANPFPIIVPCHRVVAVNGLGGFARARSGYTLVAKHWLLAHEKVA